MTREEQRKIKEDKKRAKINARLNRQQEREELKGCNKMVEKAKAKGAWIEEIS